MSRIEVKGIKANFIINLDKICYVETLEDELIIAFEHNWIAFGTAKQKGSNWNKVSDSEFEGLKKNIDPHSPYWIK